MIEATGVSKRVSNGNGWLDILSNLDLEVAAGDSVAIIGRSGAGKTTLLSILAGLDLPTAGSIALSGQDITVLDEEQRARLRAGRVGFVFQAFQLLDSFTALENVRLSAELAGLPRPDQKARQALTEVELSHRLSHMPRQLSGGEKQRVALARAFAGEPDILFADEPTGNLDEETGARIIDQLFHLNQQEGATLILITHDPELAARCQRCLRLHNGVLTESAS